MELTPQRSTVEQIHTRIAECTGRRLRVKANMGRSKVIERMGTVTEAHPSLFVVEVEERRGRKATQSYQYVDILTGTVELSDAQSGEPLFSDFTQN